MSSITRYHQIARVFGLFWAKTKLVAIQLRSDTLEAVYQTTEERKPMVVKVRERKPGEWWCFAADGDQRKAKKCGTLAAAEKQEKKWNALVTLGQQETIFFTRVV